MTARLIEISYSPWSARAGWALDLCGIPYQREEYVPMLGEPILRARLRRFSGKVSVPAYIDGKTRIMGSRAIAEYAVENGMTAHELFPTAKMPAIERWEALSEQMLSAGRALVAQKTSESDEAMLASVPFPMPGPLRPLGKGLAKSGIWFLAAKYSFDPESTGRHEQLIRLGLVALEDALDRIDGDWLLGSFSWADLVMASALQFVEPAPDEFIPLKEELRPVWTCDGLADEYPGLLEWRARVFNELRR